MCVDVPLSWGSSLNLPEIPECVPSLTVSWMGEECEVPRVDLQGSVLVEECKVVRTGVLDERRSISLGSLSLTRS